MTMLHVTLLYCTAHKACWTTASCVLEKQHLMDQQLSGSVSACEEEVMVVLACARLNISIMQIINWRELKLDDIYPCMLCDTH